MQEIVLEASSKTNFWIGRKMVDAIIAGCRK
jgi:hypothetical protein